MEEQEDYFNIKLVAAKKIAHGLINSPTMWGDILSVVAILGILFTSRMLTVI